MAIDFESHVLSSYDVRRIARTVGGEIETDPRPSGSLAWSLYGQSVYRPMLDVLESTPNTRMTQARSDRHPFLQSFISVVRVVRRLPKFLQ